MPVFRRLSATARTVALSVVLIAVAIAVGLAWFTAHGSATLLSDPSGTIALAVAFFLAEYNLITFEFRREAHSMTFAGVPLALGAMIIPVPALILARALGSISAMLAQRTTGEKLVYNSSAFAFEAAITGSLCHAFVGPRDDITSVLILVGCIAAVDQFMTLLVLLVIRLHGARMGRAEALEVCIQSLVLSVVATSFAVVLRIMLDHGATGWTLAAVLIGVAVLGYRMHAAAVSRHSSLTMVHEFVAEGAAVSGLDEVAVSSLSRIREMLHAAAAELALSESANREDGAEIWTTVYHLDDDDRLVTERRSADPGDWVRMRALHHGHATLAVRGRDSAIDTWLDSAGPGATALDDAIVVGVRSGTSAIGTLTVSGRLTTMAVFTDTDVTMLQTLAGHLAASLENARLVETLRYDATHDALTGLANRQALGQAVDALDDQACAAMLRFDLDNFKEVNDVLGHETGDRLLLTMAKRLQASAHPGTTVARLGGNEFALLLELAPADAEATSRATAAEIVGSITQPVRLTEAVIVPEVSAGISLTPHVRRPDLLRCADTALDAAKACDDRVTVYTPALDVGGAERLALVADLRAALADNPGQFAVYMQPKVDLATGSTEGAEALVRWLHPSLGLVPPDKFIGLAETTGLISELTRHVLAVALRECASWEQDGSPVTVAVNLSPRVLDDPGIVDLIREALRTAGVPATRLVLEITESVLMADPESAIDILSKLAALGVSISLDDFGTGYSSLAYLQRLPVDELKIDKSFVDAVGSGEPDAEALFRSIAALGNNLGLRTVAEGIETAPQVATVARLGCSLGQGYHFSRPIPAHEFRRWLERARITPSLRALPSPA
jgi:diguanylate cyclase (GGDEF)-like protein